MSFSRFTIRILYDTILMNKVYQKGGTDMNTMKNVSKLLKNGMVRKGAKLQKAQTPPALSEGVFDKISEPVSEYFTVGFAKTDIMPDDLDKRKYYVAGYRAYNPAKGALDPMTTSAVYIDDNSGRGGVVFVSVDSVGLTSYDVDIIRGRLIQFQRETGCRSINILSTHNHAAIDTVGMWGPLPKTGRDKKYMQILHDGVVRVVKDAYSNRKNGSIFYGKKEAPDIQRDSRLPHVFCKDLTRLRFVPEDGSTEVWILNFASHTESLLGKNSFVSADFACYMRRDIWEMAHAESILFVGAIGGLIRLKELDEDNVKSTLIGGRRLAETAVAISDERKLSPVINILHQEYYCEADNFLLATICNLHIIRSSFFATGEGALGLSVKTEMTYFEIGELNMLLLPCELFPELAYGGYLSEQESAEGKSPDINPRPLIEIAGDKDLLVFGVANDFTGYVVPPNDFMLDPEAPYVTDAKDRLGRKHYEETNSLGPKTAYVIAEVFEKVMRKVKN